MKTSLRFMSAVLVLGMATVIHADNKAGEGTASASKPIRATTPAQLKVQSDALEIQLKDDYQYVVRLEAVIAKKKDVIKHNCINDKLVQLKHDDAAGARPPF